MIRLYSNNGSTGPGMVIPSFFLFLIIFLCVSLPAKGIPSMPLETIYNRQNPFPEKFFLNIDNGLMTLITRNSPLGSILDEISSRSGIKINISPALRSKKVTVRWTDAPFEESVKKIAESCGLIIDRDELGIFYLTEGHAAPEPIEKFIKIKEKAGLSLASNDVNQAKAIDFNPVSSASPGKDISQNKNTQNNIHLNEMVIRFRQGISEQDINKFLAEANIKIKKYIAALHYHILSLPDGMTYYDAMILLQSKKMLYKEESDYLIPVKQVQESE